MAASQGHRCYHAHDLTTRIFTRDGDEEEAQRSRWMETWCRSEAPSTIGEASSDGDRCTYRCAVREARPHLQESGLLGWSARLFDRVEVVGAAGVDPVYTPTLVLEGAPSGWAR